MVIDENLKQSNINKTLLSQLLCNLSILFMATTLLLLFYFDLV